MAEKAEKKTRVTFSVRAEVGSKVFLAGCFNNWDPTAKQMEDKKGTGEFTCCINLPKGKYEYKFVIDGVWVADGECPDWVQNDMGSMNSVKIVD
jgi:1,4-alpha-glucan branching enzyme